MAMATRLFIQKDNIQMLWDIVSDEDVFRFLSPDIQSKLSQLFINNIQGFYENEKTKTNSLVELNKKYMVLILNHIKSVYPNQSSKITIHKEEHLEQPTLIKNLVTYEEIQSDRKSQFEKDFSKRQEEFEDIMNVKVPPVPEFSNKQTDVPIKEMDKILKEMTAQRNYDVEQITKSITDPSKWLKSQETSLKSEKLSPNLALKESSPNDKKQVSWNNVLDDDEEYVNIFSKLKKVPPLQNIPMEDNMEDRLTKIERSHQELNDKMDKILLHIFNLSKDGVKQ